MGDDEFRRSSAARDRERRTRFPHQREALSRHLRIAENPKVPDERADLSTRRQGPGARGDFSQHGRSADPEETGGGGEREFSQGPA